MSPRIALVFLAGAFALSGIAASQETATDKSGSKLEFGALPLPIQVFSTVDPSNRNGLRKPNSGVQFIQDPYERRYDVTEFLKAYGVSFPPGSVAIYDDSANALLVRNTAANLSLIHQIFANLPPIRRSFPVSVEISAYECTLPGVESLARPNRLTFFDLQNLPKGSLKLIDHISILTKSGDHVIRATNAAQPKEDGDVAGNSALPPGKTGMQLEVEPIGAGGLIDLNINCKVRARLESDDDDIMQVNFNTSFTVWQDYPVVIHVVPIQDQKGKYLVIVARASMNDLGRWTLPKPKFPFKAASTIKTADVGGIGVGRGMLIKAYNVPRGAFSVIRDGHPTAGEFDPVEFLSSSGVGFPPGSAAVYEKDISTLFVFNTLENLDLADVLLEGDYGPLGLVNVELSAYEFTFPGGKDRARFEKLTFADLEQMPNGSVRALGRIAILTRSGQRSTTGKLFGPPHADKTNTDAQEGRWDFLRGESGIRMIVQTRIGPDLQTINADVEYQMRTGLEKDDPETMDVKFDGTFAAKDDRPLVIHVAPRPAGSSPGVNRGGKYIAIVARAFIVNSGGWELPKQKPIQTPAPQSPRSNPAPNP